MKSTGKTTKGGKGYMIRKIGTELYSQGGFFRPKFGPKEKGKIWTSNSLGAHLAQYRKRDWYSKTITLNIPVDWEIIPVEVLIIEREDPFSALEHVKTGRSHKRQVDRAKLHGYKEV